MDNLANSLISFLIYPPEANWLFVVKAIFIIVSISLGVAIIFCLLRCSYLKFLIYMDVAEILTYRPFGLKRIEKDWNKVKVRLDAGLESEYKLAIIEADNMMDSVLKRMGYGGENLGERLGNLTSATLPNIEEIKEVHQMKNNIIRDPSYTVTLDDTRKIMDVYEKGFQDLQAF